MHRGKWDPLLYMDFTLMNILRSAKVAGITEMVVIFIN